MHNRLKANNLRNRLRALDAWGRLEIKQEQNTMKKIKITLRGQGGELDSRVIPATADDADPFDNGDVNDVMIEMVTACTFSVGDTITIEEID